MKDIQRYLERNFQDFQFLTTKTDISRGETKPRSLQLILALKAEIPRNNN